MSNEDLVLMIQGNEDKARHLGELYEQNRGAIANIAKRYSEYAEIEDLMQESFFGLSEAAARWDPEAGTKFISYASYWIRAAIISYLRKREPAAVSLSAPIGGENDDITLEDVIKSDADAIGDTLEAMSTEQLASVLWPMVEELESLQAAVIKERYRKGSTYKQCGAALGIPEGKARRKEEKALQKLRTRKAVLLPFMSDSERYSKGLSFTGLSYFKNTGMSSQERAVIIG